MMNIIVTGRHLELDDDIKDYAEKKLLKAETFFDQIIEAHIVMSAEKHRRSAEVTLNAKNVTFHANVETDDIYRAIDGVMEKVEAQVKKYKEKIRDHKHRTKGIVALDEETDIEDDLENAPESSSEIQIVKVSKFAQKPMTIEEAAIQIKLTDKNFLMFSNFQTNQVNVVYKRKDGTYGWIEPDLE